ncbi:tripartite tricarboxylate transporter substrate binding protein [Clostridium sp. chh4-2]|nr:tripartite tricarboxylate transporter substrate binding protein [Clostridium sp. chh4-2]
MEVTMMKKTMKLSAALLIPAMMLSLSACGGKTAQPETTAPAGAAPKTETSADSASAASTTAAPDTTAAAQDETAWPERAVSIIVGANPGGGQDASARLYAKYLSKYTGQAFTVTNISGGSGSIASSQAKDSKPDGYTILMSHEALENNKASGTVDFDYTSFDIGGIALTSKSQALITNGKKFKTMDEMIEYAKANPGSIIAGTEWGGSSHQNLLSVEQCLGIDLDIVDGGAVGERTAAMAGGHMDLQVASIGNVADYIKTGEFTALIMFNDSVIDTYSEYPCSTDYGIDYVYDKFYGLFFPKGTDPAILAKCHGLLEQMAADPEFIAEAQALELVPGIIEDEETYLDNTLAHLIEYNKKYVIE